MAGTAVFGQAANQAPSSGDLYGTAKDLFDTYAPSDVKSQYDFPSRQQFETGLHALQSSVDTDSLEQLAQYEPQARALLATLRGIPGDEGYAEWLASRLDEVDAARAIGNAPKSQAPAPEHGTYLAIPYYREWLQRVQGRPLPPAAPRLMPSLQSAFAAQGVPPQLAWVAEAESSLNPDAESPAGAKGLFQLKAETARSLGLSTFLPDERTNAGKSAAAAARDLRSLGRRFGSWPLALAAYNAGEGRVGRLLAAKHATTYAEIAPYLPGETRMYVPKVCALMALRSGKNIGEIPAPQVERIVPMR